MANLNLTTVSRVLVLAAFASLLGACGEKEVAKADLEQSAMKALSASVGKPSPPITCPSGIPAKVGATLTCSMPIDDKTYDVKVSVKSLDGANAAYDVEVAGQPRP